MCREIIKKYHFINSKEFLITFIVNIFIKRSSILLHFVLAKQKLVLNQMIFFYIFKCNKFNINIISFGLSNIGVADIKTNLIFLLYFKTFNNIFATNLVVLLDSKFEVKTSVSESQFIF